MITKYLTKKYSSEITPIECVSETEMTVMVVRFNGNKPSRAAKVSDYEQYHDTWEAARAYLVERAEGRVRAARAELSHAENEARMAAALENPEVQS